MNNANLATLMKQRRKETIARNKRKREQRTYVGNISVRNIVRNLAKVSNLIQKKTAVILLSATTSTIGPDTPPE